MLRDSNGLVCLHSRHAFGSVGSKYQAYFLSLVWSIESMVSHKVSRVHFSFERRMLANAINRPKA